MTRPENSGHQQEPWGVGGGGAGTGLDHPERALDGRGIQPKLDLLSLCFTVCSQNLSNWYEQLPSTWGFLCRL